MTGFVKKLFSLRGLMDTANFPQHSDPIKNHPTQQANIFYLSFRLYFIFWANPAAPT